MSPSHAFTPSIRLLGPPPRRLRLRAKRHIFPTLTTLHPRRSKMILTRRIHAWTLKPPPPPKSTTPHPREKAPPPRNHVPTNPTFIFRRPPTYTHKRRAADPPYRYLQISTTNVPNLPPRAPERTSRLTLTSEKLFKPSSSDNTAPPKTTPPIPLPLYAHLSKLSDRIPRLIVIGDVHGCITELQALLKLAHYQPGDQVLLLGDLVAKGPDSVAVVQLAKELGARAVRGNHDYEVLRWNEIRKRDGWNDVSLEHARIAENLSQAEHAWLMDCPWFIESPQMNYLFVHAGFIPGVKLTQQNPRLMMNMRSVLKDGTVTARNVLGCEWGRLWQGPQTVVFGHDAYRGLQRYDYAVGIDTGCVYGGRLTALLLPENRLVSVAAKRAYISPKRFRTPKEPSP